MYCTHCGQALSDHAKFCAACGTGIPSAVTVAPLGAAVSVVPLAIPDGAIIVDDAPPKAGPTDIQTLGLYEVFAWVGLAVNNF